MTSPTDVRLTAQITIAALASDPPGHVIRAMVRKDTMDVEVIGPTFAESTLILRQTLASICDILLQKVQEL
jgi:hypothetical protein